MTTRRVAFVLSNPAVSSVTGWPIGFWLEELTHPYREFEAAGFDIELFSPNGGALHIDEYSDPTADNGYSADDEISKAFLDDPDRRAMLDDTSPLERLDPSRFDTVFLVGGQGPMETFAGNAAVEQVVRDFLEAGKPTTVVCHATCVLLSARGSDGRLLVDGRRWTGFANSEEEFAESAVGQRFQPFWIEQRASELQQTTFVVGPPFESHVIRDGDLITGQQQHSSGDAAALAIEALG